MHLYIMVWLCGVGLGACCGTCVPTTSVSGSLFHFMDSNSQTQVLKISKKWFYPQRHSVSSHFASFQIKIEITKYIKCYPN